MWHSLQEVATTHNFNFKKFEAFAIQNQAKYALTKIGSNWSVNTWNCNTLTDAFRNLIIVERHLKHISSHCDNPDCMCNFKSALDKELGL